ncbi:uncharacterized protein LOC143422382 [Xylocopa sonorina]|uniref:uncharacterized protein LOC143422382 n=1 Tax=Xylocopa sonorina TaxID=1818115 RepID=UPI00403B24AE
MFSRGLLVCVFLLSGGGDAAPITERRMTVSKMSAMDLDSSATQYVYNQQQGLPLYYVRYTNHGSGQYHHPPDAVQYVVGAGAPVAQAVHGTASFQHPYGTAKDVPRSTHQDTGNYGNEQSAGHAAAIASSVPRAPYYVHEQMIVYEGDGKGGARGKTSEEDYGKGNSEEDYSKGGGEESHEEDDEDDEERIHSDFGESIKGLGYDGGYGHGGGESRGDEGIFFEDGSGKERMADEYSQRGDKGEKGYKTLKEFSESEQGSDDNKHDEGYYKKEGGHKKGHVDEAEKHGSHEEAEKGKEGGSYGHSSYHKKGHKTNGYHNVYHKDEYKKETDYYDDEHKKGHFVEYEEFDKSYKNDGGDSKKGGHHSSGHDYLDSGKKGYYDKGHHDALNQGHQAEAGEKSYYNNHEDYGAEKDSKSERTHKYHKDR